MALVVSTLENLAALTRESERRVLPAAPAAAAEEPPRRGPPAYASQEEKTQLRGVGKRRKKEEGRKVVVKQNQIMTRVKLRTKTNAPLTSDVNSLLTAHGIIYATSPNFTPVFLCYAYCASE